MKPFLRKLNKALLLVVAVLLPIVAAIGGTVAWLADTSGTIINTFTPGKVPIEIEEKFENDVKENVVIRNTGNVDAYIRVALVPVWRNDDGSVVTGSGMTASLDQCEMTLPFPGEGWKQEDDGYYYYNPAVKPTEATKALITECKVKTGLGDAYKGKRFDLQILAQSVQADGLGEDINTAQEAFAFVAASTPSSPVPSP